MSAHFCAAGAPSRAPNRTAGRADSSRRLWRKIGQGKSENLSSLVSLFVWLGPKGRRNACSGSRLGPLMHPNGLWAGASGERRCAEISNSSPGRQIGRIDMGAQSASGHLIERFFCSRAHTQTRAAIWAPKTRPSDAAEISKLCRLPFRAFSLLPSGGSLSLFSLRFDLFRLSAGRPAGQRAS